MSLIPSNYCCSPKETKCCHQLTDIKKKKKKKKKKNLTSMGFCYLSKI